MAIAISVSPLTDDDNGAGVASVVLNSVATGDTILVGVGWRDDLATTISTVTVSGESNASLVGSFYDSNSGTETRAQFALLSNVTTGGNKTVTVNMSAASGMHMFALALSGCDTSNALDDIQAATGNSTTPSVNVTTSGAGHAVFAIVTTAGGGEPSPGTGYTAIPFGNVWWWNDAEYDLDVGSAGVKSATASTGSGVWDIVAVAIKAAGGGGGPALRRKGSLALYGVGR